MTVPPVMMRLTVVRAGAFAHETPLAITRTRAAGHSHFDARIADDSIVTRCIFTIVPVHLVDHPVAQDALALLRDRTTSPTHFRRLAHRVSLLLAMEATRDLPLTRRDVETPLEVTGAGRLEVDVVVVPVLRAGLGMLDAVLEVLPHARVGHIGLQRDEQTAIASQYYQKLPGDLSKSTALIVDPMLATGGSAVAAITMLQRAGAEDIRLVCIVAAPEGITEVERAHPGVHIFTPAIDRELNAHKYILPGLGDFGDRLYGTM
jgi:uracil phosphoribosyltransferase